MLPRLRECSRQVEAEVVNNSSNKIHQTWEALFWQTLYKSQVQYYFFRLLPSSIESDIFLALFKTSFFDMACLMTWSASVVAHLVLIII